MRPSSESRRQRPEHGSMGPGAGKGLRSRQGGRWEAAAGAGGEGWGSKERGHRSARHREAGPALLCQGYESGTGAAVPVLPPSWGPWETPFCSEGPGLSCFPPRPQLLRVQPWPAAPVWTAQPPGRTNTAVKPLPPRRPATTHNLRYCSQFTRKPGAARRRGLGQHACRLSVAFPS